MKMIFLTMNTYFAPLNSLMASTMATMFFTGTLA